MVAPINTSVIRDENRQTIWWGVSSVDGTTLVPIQMSSSTGKVMMEIGVSTMAVMSAIPATMPREGNRIPCLAGQSSSNSSVVLPVSVNPVTGAIQAQTT
jgi:hypothetical protein